VLEAVVELTFAPAFSLAAADILTEDESQAYLVALIDRLEEIEEEEGPIHRLLGYPDTIQDDDIQTASQLGSSGDAAAADPAARVAGATDWGLLLQIDSDHATRVTFGDSGRIYLAMRGDDLEAQRWGRAWLTLQSY